MAAVPNVNYYLKQPSSLTPTLIYLQVKYTLGDIPQRLMLSTGDKVLPTEWNSTKKRAIVTKKNPGNGDINLYLDKIENCFKHVFRNCLIDNITPTADVVKIKMEEELNMRPIVEVKKMTFYNFFQTLINESKVNKTAGTIKTYNATLNRIKDFGASINKEFSFDDITLEWRANFIEYLQSIGLSKNTTGKHIKVCKWMLSEATERNLNTNFAFKNKNFTKPCEPVHKIYLTKDEIEKIAELDLSGQKIKSIVRDYFVIASLTGLRFSDFSRIGKEHIKNDKIQIVTEKTNQEVVIPLAPLVKNVFEKYDYNLPRCPCNQVFNRYLKEVGKAAGLTSTEYVTKTIGGIKTTKAFQRWELLSSHTGRRTLISLAILEGINTNSVMRLSGHRSLSVFENYVKFDAHQNADKLAEHSFFN